MALVQYGDIITRMRGSIGGVTFHRNRAGEIARLRGATVRTLYPRQIDSQAIPSKFVRLWNDLTLAEQLQWNTFADANPHENVYGDVKNLSGFNYFFSVNYYIELGGGSLISTPPAFTLPTEINTFTLTVDASQILITFDEAYNDPNAYIVILSTRPLRRTTTSFRRFQVITKIDTSNPIATVDITSEWESVHGVPHPISDSGVYNIGVLIYSVHKTTGLITPAKFEIAELDLGGIGFWVIGDTFIIS